MVIKEGMTLAEAIVAQACEDYRLAIRGRINNPEYMLADVLRFFRSEWYKSLTDIDSKWLQAQLDKEWEEGKKLIAAGDYIKNAELKKEYYFICPLCRGRAHMIERRYKRKNKIEYMRSYYCRDCDTTELNVLVRTERRKNERNFI